MKLVAYCWCGGFGLLVGWPPFEPLVGTPFVVVGCWIVRHGVLGGVMVSFCWCLFWVCWTLGPGVCRGIGYIDVGRYQRSGMVLVDLGFGGGQGDPGEPTRFCPLTMLPGEVCGEDRIQLC